MQLSEEHYVFSERRPTYTTLMPCYDSHISSHSHEWTELCHYVFLYLRTLPSPGQPFSKLVRVTVGCVKDVQSQ